MKADFSKPSGDIKDETDNYTCRNREVLERQIVLSNVLKQQAKRAHCLLCQSRVPRDHGFTHRGVQYFMCRNCGHIQTANEPPLGFPQDFHGPGFDEIYPRLSAEEYLSRRDRVYKPKLNWILNSLSKVGTSVEEAMQSEWIELGCGAGYFLHALKERGAKRISGVDASPELVKIANYNLGEKLVEFNTGNLHSEVSGSTAAYYVAFFVLEHLDDPKPFWEALMRKPKGTYVIFSVPMFGLSTLLEGRVTDYAARNLDSGVHTQLYTDKSIKYVLDQYGFSGVRQWVFGQDAMDFARLIDLGLSRDFSKEIGRDISSSIKSIVDDFQQLIDKKYRHRDIVIS